MEPSVQGFETTNDLQTFRQVDPLQTSQTGKQNTDQPKLLDGGGSPGMKMSSPPNFAVFTRSDVFFPFQVLESWGR